MPTRASYSHSKNGRRTGWVDTVLDQDSEKIKEIVSTWAFSQVEILLHEYVRQAA
jgi:hypothetical protein